MLQTLQNRLKSPDSIVSLILGLAVVFVIGTLTFNYFSKRPAKLAEEKKTEAMQEANAIPGTHTVTAGETLWSISEKYYQTGYKWVDIRDANTLANPTTLEVGQILTIPEAASIAPVVQPEGEMIAASTEDVKPATYTVVKDDMLWTIAVKFYNGDGYAWVKIAQANKLANPNLIHTGNVLTLP